MAGKEKKMAAAMAAVSLYLEQETAAAAEQKKVPDRAGGFGQSPWGLSGRQEIMTMRRLTQLRVFTRI
ncbi:hypothetical protein [Desulfomarina sp.]